MSYKDSKQLDAAILHLDEVLGDPSRTWDCACRKDHENLFGWLNELKQLRKMVDKLARKLEKSQIDPLTPLGLTMQALADAKIEKVFLVQHWDSIRWSDETYPNDDKEDQFDQMKNLEKRYPGHKYRVVERTIIDKVVDNGKDGD